MALPCWYHQCLTSGGAPLGGYERGVNNPNHPAQLSPSTSRIETLLPKLQTLTQAELPRGQGGWSPADQQRGPTGVQEGVTNDEERLVPPMEQWGVPPGIYTPQGQGTVPPGAGGGVGSRGLCGGLPSGKNIPISITRPRSRATATTMSTAASKFFCCTTMLATGSSMH